VCVSEKKKVARPSGSNPRPVGSGGGSAENRRTDVPDRVWDVLGAIFGPGGPKNRFLADGPRGRTHGSKLAPTPTPDPKIRSRGRTEVICEKSIFGPKKGRLESLDHVFERGRGGFVPFCQNLARADTIYSVGDENQV